MNIKTHFQKDWIYYLALGMAIVSVAIDLKSQNNVPMLAAVQVFAVVMGYLNIIKPNKSAAALGFWILAVYVALALMEMIPATKENIFVSVISFIPAYLGAYGGYYLKLKTKTLKNNKA